MFRYLVMRIQAEKRFKRRQGDLRLSHVVVRPGMAPVPVTISNAKPHRGRNVIVIVSHDAVRRQRYNTDMRRSLSEPMRHGIRE